jgi:predicted nucleic acid-binding protein
MFENIIIADASCIIALKRIERLSLLSDLFGVVTVTSEVEEEIGETLPNWIKTIKVKNRKTVVELNSELNSELDLGEASAIALALENESHLLIIDERKGREKAQNLGLNYIGLLALIVHAKKKNLLNKVSPILQELEALDFRMSQKLKSKILELAGE